MLETGHISVSGDRTGRYTFLWRVIFLYVVGILFLIYLGCVVWTWLVDSASPLDKRQQAWVLKTADEVRVELAKEAPATRPTLVICDFAGEPTGALTDAVRKALGGKTQYIVKDRTAGKKIRDFLRLLPKGVSSPDEAAKAAKEQGAELALFGVCERLAYDVDGKLEAIVKITIVNTKGEVVKHFTLVTDKSADLGAATAGVPSKPGALEPDKADADLVVPGFTWQKFLGWSFFVLLFPMTTINFLIHVTRKNSNLANAVMWFFYTFIDGILAWFLFAAGMRLWGIGGNLFFVLLIAAALIYNLKIMAFARKIGEEA